MASPLNEYKYCSTQVNLNSHAATRVLMAGDMIPDAVLGVEGREEQPHLTIQYGIETDDVDAVRRAIVGLRPFEITLGLTDAFPPSEHSSGDSPLFVTIKKGTEQLVALRNAVRSAGPVHDSFPIYTPHVCIAYVKNEAVDSLKGKDWLSGTVVLVSGVTFSNRDGTHTYLPFGMSESALPRINRLLDRIDEGEDLSLYNRPDDFRAKFGHTSVADHSRMADEFKARAEKLKGDYEKRTSVKAMGASKYTNLRYFDNSPEGKQFNALMNASRKHKKVADLLKKSNRAAIDETVGQIERAAQAAASMTRKQYDASEFPSTVMSYDIARAAARDRGLALKKNTDRHTTPDNPGAAILKVIDDIRVSKGGKRQHAHHYKPRVVTN